jgi:hypothetical protein
VALVVSTAGTVGTGSWVAIDRRALDAVAAELASVGLSGAVLLSQLPWDEASGVVLDLISPILTGACEVVVHERLDDLCAMGSGVDTSAAPVLLHAEPATIAHLAMDDDGTDLLLGLDGGLVTGARVASSLSTVLAATRLRAAYGQAEGTALVTLGRPGDWGPGGMGRPIGCQTRLMDGELWFRGTNASVGTFVGGSLHRLPGDRWVASGDIVTTIGLGRLSFVGRRAETCQLASGKLVRPGPLEVAICATAGIDEAIVWSTESGGLEVITSEPIDVDVVELVLGPLAEWIESVRHVPSDRWVRTARGSADRSRTLGR